MGFLRLLKVEYSGDKYDFTSPALDKDICIVEGPNGTGKSTFFNLVYFGLGGKVAEFDVDSKNAHKEVVGDSNNLVRLVVNVSGHVYTLTRKINENLVTVFRDTARSDEVGQNLSVMTLPIYRKDSEQRTFSDWILDQLGIPVVEIFQAGRNFKLNFSDLSRLIYHNQSPDPHGIFKPADSNNFITDSLEIRRAIFQILVGKTLLALYEAIGKMKLADRDVQAAKAIHQEYEGIVTELLKASGINTVQNVKSLQDQVQALEGQIQKLLIARNEIATGGVDQSGAKALLDAQLRALQEKSSINLGLESQLTELRNDAIRLIDLERALKDDIERINKVIYTHEQLSLFSSETCPFCLNAVQRPEHKCVCGHDVDENDYQRFFYSSAEYLDILRSKSKALDTLRLASKDVQEELSVLTIRREELNREIERQRTSLEERVGGNDARGQVMEQIEEKVFSTRADLHRIQEVLRLETKLDGLQGRLSARRKQYELAKIEVNKLDAASSAELQGQLAAFNFAYNDMMTSVLADCRVAGIDSETYLPVINNGEYREASADVPKRFLYYVTLLQLSLVSDIPFPRLLLVDTPETAGIDRENLLKMLRYAGSLKNPESKPFQMLLSTGVGKYPPEFEQFVVLKLSNDGKLLRERVTN